MARIATIARRTFLIGTAAVAGGVAIGYFAYKREADNPLLDDLGQGEATLNPYVRIDADGVTLITPRADKGQGAVSIQAALIAEEMDLAWGGFKTDFGVPSAAYYNGKVAVEGFPIAATSDTLLARAGRQAGDVIGKFTGMQITGGSSTVSDAFDKLRVAGAVARQMLLRAAAQQTGLALAELKTQDGAVILPDGKALSYASLAAAAALVEPPTDVALKPEAEWRYLGKPMLRLDTVAKSTGTALYGIDVRLPDMVYATVRANPRLGGGMVSMDASEAEKARGVIKVVALPQGFGVIANNTWRAFQAAALVKPVWGPSPYPETSEALWTSLDKAFEPGQHDSRFRDEGDVGLMLQTAGDDVFKAEYRVPYLAHAPLEPMTAVAQFKDGLLEIWTGTQIPGFLVKGVAGVTGIDAENIRLHVLPMGGSFGRRLEDDYVKQAALLAQAHPGVPIKLTWTREEDMTHDFPRPQAIARLQGTVKDQQVQAFALDIASTSVSASQMGRLGFPAAGPDVAIVAGAWDQPFAIPHYRVTGYKAPAAVPVSSWRSVGASGNGFLHESAMDEMIHAAGADPLAERLRLCSHEPSKRVLQAVGDMSDWATPLVESPDGPRGRGLAFTLSFGVPVAEVVEVTATANGIRIDKVFVACEVGKVLDPVNFENQVQGGVVFGLGHAINCELTYEGGAPQQTNFYAYAGLRLNQTPAIMVKALETTDEVRGIGEPSVPPAAPALANAIYAATGQRIRELPLNKAVGFA
ncbi:isoquinoline 1-oxidoreductase [Hydrogenophaga crassostreae]|uniref:Isoquinoline 1-oxidoreductase n=1 Tax=Hydrogenophaga crassostreae TaxID=1763535 RepID=A0A167GFH6_9BURK|nr:molybdopterin cofactor-binding domain-containing protein [Hydrogenophaga crassostreae]AOW11544.1 isoquinoline 1-oxidoreductase [Hydrogenophaga crassostreae]OAD39383.1 isoquinoline 1-oxidoreductase [Hydrogenophaga crassostreae]